MYGIGYIGHTKDIERKSYKIWNDMLKRCYTVYNENKDVSYRSCVVSSEWHSYSNFKKWFDENYYEVDNEKNVFRQRYIN